MGREAVGNYETIGKGQYQTDGADAILLAAKAGSTRTELGSVRGKPAAQSIGAKL